VKKIKDIRASSLTVEQRKEFKDAARRTWQSIGFDVLNAVAAAEGMDVNRVSMKRAEVIEVVLDADNMITNWGLVNLELALLEFCRHGNYEDKIRLLNSVFCSTEGM